MLKFALVIFIPLVFLSVVKGQDRIVTVENDTLHCEIDSINYQKVFYSFVQQGNRISNEISLKSVFSIDYKGDDIHFKADTIDIDKRHQPISSENSPGHLKRDRSLLVLKPADEMPIEARVELSGFYLKQSNNMKLVALSSAIVTSLLIAITPANEQGDVMIGLVGGGISVYSFVNSIFKERKAALYLDKAYSRVQN